MKHIEIEEVSKILGSYDKLANKVANNELEICYRLNTFVASVDDRTDEVNSIEKFDDFFIAEKTQDLLELIKYNEEPLKLLATKKAVKLKHPTKQKNALNKWVFLENTRTTLLLQQAIEDGKIIYSPELIPDEILDPYKIQNYGRKIITRQDLFITQKSWSTYKRNPKTNTGISRTHDNSIDDLHQLIFILKHIIVEESGATQEQLNDQIVSLLNPKGTKLHVSKINKIFSEANKHKIDILRKNIISIFDIKTNI